MIAAQPAEVAVVGIGCRVPPNVCGPEHLWSFLLAGGDAVRAVPSDRWRWEAWYDPDGSKPGKMDVTRAAFLDQRIEDFDAGFFHVSPREAGQVDPQQRLLLEVSWEAFEDAGIDVWDLRGSSTGVFVGAFMLDNLVQRADSTARDEIGPQTATTCTNTVLASRLSYFYDLRGPAFTVDTACSSSLVAVHQAVRSLAAGECEVAVAGGVNRIFRPEPMLMMSKGQFLAPDGRSKSFSAHADGYGRGEGCGLVVLKHLADAERDGDRIYAVIEGSGVNQDGRTGGPALPSADAQAELIDSVLDRSGVAPATISYVEAHGTGTPVGDPAEMEAVGRTLGAATGRPHPCVVGSIKAGIGHLEGAAGVIGLVKAALVAERGKVPPQAWLDELNPEIGFEELGLQIATETVDLPQDSADGRVAVNSFGYGGTNAHAVLRAHRSTSPVQQVSTSGDVEPSGFFPPVAVLSAHDDEAVGDLALAYARQLRTADPGEHRRLLAAMAQRTVHRHRRVAFAPLEEMASVLERLAIDGAHPDVIAATAPPGGRSEQPVFVFSGMGPQWWGMGRVLLERHPGFGAHVDRCDELFVKLAGWSLREALAAEETTSQMARTAVAQPCSFVLQTGLCAVLRELGVTPAAVVGHSVGEVAAAYEAGVLGLGDALSVVFHRSRLQATTAGGAGMLATDLPEDDARQLAADAGAAVSVAAVNGSRASTLAGDRGALERIAAAAEEAGGFARLLDVEVAYHSPAMDPILDDLQHALSGISPERAQVPLYSTVGPEHDGGGWDASYWAANARRPVAFWPAMQRVVDDQHRSLLEVGAHPVLALYLRDAVGQVQGGHVVSTLHRRQDDRRSLAMAVARMWTAGVDVDWSPLVGRARPTGLPLYPWQRQPYWHESETTRRVRTGGPTPDKPLAGHVVSSSPLAREVDLSPTTLPWCRDHLVDGVAVFPATGFLELVAVHAHKRGTHGTGAMVIEDLRIDRPLVLPEGQDPILRLTEDSDQAHVSVTSRSRSEPEGWRANAVARVGRGPFDPPSPADRGWTDAEEDLVALDITVDEMYTALAGAGLEYRGDFRAVRRIHHSDRRVEVQLDAGGDLPDGYLAYPPLLDAGLHGALAAYALAVGHLYVPTSIRRTVIHAPLTERCVARAEVLQHTDHQLVADCAFFSDDGSCLAELHGINLSPVDRPTSEASWLDACSYELRWHASTPSDGSENDRPDTSVRRLVLATPSSDLQSTLASSGPSNVAVAVIDDLSDLGETAVSAGDRVVVEVPGGESTDAEHHLDTLRALVQRLSAVAGATLVLVTRDAMAALPADRVDGWASGWVAGFRRVAANELHKLTVAQVDHDGDSDGALAGVLSDPDLAEETALRHGRCYVPELARLSDRDQRASWWRRSSPTLPAGSCDNVALQSTEATVDGLIWVETARQPPGAGEIELRIEAVGLNYKDLLKQLGALAPEMLADTFVGSHLGMEACVTVERAGPGIDHIQPGQRFLATLATGSFQRFVTVDIGRARLLEAPSSLTDHEAAGVVVAFGTAHRAIAELGRAEPGDVVLLHGATGSFGLAAIQVAHTQGASVLATASTPAKRDLLREHGVAATFNSRSHNFIDEVMSHTRGRGVDVAVNTLPGDGLRANFEVLSEGGRLIDISKREILENTNLPLSFFDRNITFASLDLDRLARDNDTFIALGQRVLDRLRAGDYQPTANRVFAAREVREAFTIQARAEHTGKVVVDLGDADRLTCHQRNGPIAIRDDRRYLITGGTGGLGPHIAAWLADRGAHHVALASRSGILDQAGQAIIEKLQASDVDIETLAVDVTDRAGLADALDALRAQGPPIAGVVHAAGVSHDVPVEALTSDDLSVVLPPKLTGAANLDRLTADDPIELFLLTSSVSATVGTSGQAAYAAANAGLEALAQRRRRQRRPAVAVGLGPVAHAGMAARTEEIARYVELLGFNPIPVEHLARILDRAIAWNRPVLGLYDLDWHAWSQAEPAAAASSRIAGVLADAASGIAADAEANTARLRTMPDDQRIATLTQYVTDALTTVLGLELGTLDPTTRLDTLGLDSLMLLEIQTRLGQTIKADIGLMNLMSVYDIQGVIGLLNERLGQADSQTRP